LELSRLLPQEALVEKEVSCNSTFMLATLPSIDAKILEKVPGF
jgi:hypothetical protein